jgi:hypothetical protein
VQQPQAGPAGGVAEESTAVTADGTSMCVKPLKTFIRTRDGGRRLGNRDIEEPDPL